MIFSILLGLFFLVQSPCYAWEYKLEPDSLQNPSIFDLYEISLEFKSRGFYALSDTTLSKVGLPFDNAYLGQDLKQNIVIKAGLVVPQNLEGVTLYDPELDVRVFHFKQRDIPYMVMGFHFSESQFKELVSPWAKVRKTSFLSLIIPEAHAQTCEIPGQDHKELAALSQTLSGEAIVKKIAECGMESLKGLADQASHSLEFFKKLATNPKQLWKETKESFVELKSFVLNINDEMKTIFAQLGSMSLPDQLDIACHLSGHVFAMVAQSFLIGPSALARNLPLAINRLKKMSEQIATAASLRKKGVKMPNNKKLADEVTRCD